jgi:cytosine/adenosine deaminase-related metal-dependent hydrolase
MLERIRSRRTLLREGDNLVIAAAELRIAAGRIVELRRLAADAAAESDVLDLGDRLLTPAFVNAHTHLSLAFLRGVDGARFQRNLVEDLYFTFESKLSPSDVRAFARMGAYESLLAGVGCVWEHYYGGLELAEALIDTGLSGVVAPTLQDLAGPGVGGAEAALEASLAIASSTRHREHGVFAALGPHATDTVSATLLQGIASIAEREHLPVHMHLAQSYDELVRVEARQGRSPLQLLARTGLLDRAPGLLLAHGIFLPEADLRLLDPARHTLVFCPSSQLQFGFPADVTRWDRANMSWVVATDCASSNDSMNLQKELRLCASAAAARVTGSAAYQRFLQTGSSDDARAAWQERSAAVHAHSPSVRSERLLERVLSLPGSLHPSFRAGAIEPFALANLIAWDCEHPAFWPNLDLFRTLAFSDTTQAIHGLWVLGKPIGTPGDFQRSILMSDAYREARREATARLERLLAV